VCVAGWFAWFNFFFLYFVWAWHGEAWAELAAVVADWLGFIFCWVCFFYYWFLFFFWLILFEWTLWDDDWSWLKLMHMMMMLDMGGLQWNMFSKLDGRETRRERPISYTNVFLINTNLFELQKYSYLYICI